MVRCTDDTVRSLPANYYYSVVGRARPLACPRNAVRAKEGWRSERKKKIEAMTRQGQWQRRRSEEKRREKTSRNEVGERTASVRSSRRNARGTRRRWCSLSYVNDLINVSAAEFWWKRSFSRNSRSLREKFLIDNQRSWVDEWASRIRLVWVTLAFRPTCRKLFMN